MIIKIDDKKIDMFFSSRENQYLNIPTEKVSIPKYLTAPYSLYFHNNQSKARQNSRKRQGQYNLTNN